MILDTKRNSRVNIRINRDLKAATVKKLATHGMTLPQAVNILCSNITNYNDYSIFGQARGPVYDLQKPSQEVLNAFKNSGNAIRKIKDNDKSVPVATTYQEAIKLAKK